MPTVKELRAELKKRNLSTKGKRPELEERLKEAEEAESYDAQRRRSERLLKAVIQGDDELNLQKLEQLLEEKPLDLDEVREDWGYAPAYTAASKGHAAVLRLLIDHGADLSAETELGVTALMIAERRQAAAAGALHAERAAQLEREAAQGDEEPDEADAQRMARRLKAAERKHASLAECVKMLRTRLELQKLPMKELGKRGALFGLTRATFEAFENRMLSEDAVELRLEAMKLVEDAQEQAEAAEAAAAALDAYSPLREEGGFIEPPVIRTLSTPSTPQRSQRSGTPGRLDAPSPLHPGTGAPPSRIATSGRSLQPLPTVGDALTMSPQELMQTRLNSSLSEREQRQREEDEAWRVQKALERQAKAEAAEEAAMQRVARKVEAAEEEQAGLALVEEADEAEEAAMFAEKVSVEAAEAKRIAAEEAEAAALLAPSFVEGARGWSRGGSSRGQSRDGTVSSGSTILRQSPLKDYWIDDIVKRHTDRLDQIGALLKELISNTLESVNVVLNLELAEHFEVHLDGTRQSKGKSVDVGLGVTATDEQIGDWQQRYEWAQEAIADIGAQPDAKWKLQRAKMAGDMIDSLLAEIHAAVPELMAETFSDAWSRLEAHLAGKPEGNADPEKDGQGEEEEVGPYSILMGRQLRTPSPPEPEPEQQAVEGLPRYRVLESALIREEVGNDSKMAGYTEVGEVIVAERTATILVERKPVMRVKFERGWASARAPGGPPFLELIKPKKKKPKPEPDTDDGSSPRPTSRGGLSRPGSRSSKASPRSSKASSPRSSKASPRSSKATPRSSKSSKASSSSQQSSPRSSESSPRSSRSSRPSPRPSPQSSARSDSSSDSTHSKKTGKKKKGKKKGRKKGKKNLAIVEELDEMHKDPKDRPWVSLSSVEQKDAKLLGWDATGWDEGDPTPMMKVFWAVRRQDQTREFRDKELLAAQRLGFTEELWDHGQSKKTPSFQLGLLLFRRNKEAKLWEWAQDADW